MQPKEEQLFRVGIAVAIQQPLQSSVGMFPHGGRVVMPVAVPIADERRVAGEPVVQVHLVLLIAVQVKQPGGERRLRAKDAQVLPRDRFGKDPAADGKVELAFIPVVVVDLDVPLKQPDRRAFQLDGQDGLAVLRNRAGQRLSHNESVRHRGRQDLQRGASRIAHGKAAGRPDQTLGDPAEIDDGLLPVRDVVALVVDLDFRIDHVGRDEDAEWVLVVVVAVQQERGLFRPQRVRGKRKAKIRPLAWRLGRGDTIGNLEPLLLFAAGEIGKGIVDVDRSVIPRVEQAADTGSQPYVAQMDLVPGIDGLIVEQHADLRELPLSDHGNIAGQAVGAGDLGPFIPVGVQEPGQQRILLAVPVGIRRHDSHIVIAVAVPVAHHGAVAEEPVVHGDNAVVCVQIPALQAFARGLL